MAVAVHATQRGGPGPEDDVLIIGAGGIGAFLIHAVSRSGANVVVVDMDDSRLEIALSLGAAQAITPDSQTRPAPVAPTMIFEATGTSGGLRLALDSAAPGSRVVLVGIQGESNEIEMGPITVGEIDLVGTNAHVFTEDFPEAIRLLAAREQGWADVAPMVYPLADLVDEGLRPIVERRATRIKTIIDPWANEPRRLSSG